MSPNALHIKTPEGVTFSLPLAGPTVRCFAALLDIFIIMACNTAIMTPLAALSLISADLVGFCAIIIQFLLNAGYCIATERLLSGQTFGKKVFGIRVLDAKGLPLRFHQILIRNILRPIDQLPLFYLVGALSCLCTRSFQRLGDLAAGTVVIISQRLKPEDLPKFALSKYNTLMAVPHIAARLRQTIPAEVASIAVAALNRAGELEPQARIQVFGALCSALLKHCDIPGDYIEGIPDEALVSDIVQVLYGERKKAEP
jgi:uncharacterized RDD family membrane protein YckC